MAHVEIGNGQNNMDVGAIYVQGITTCQNGESMPTEDWTGI